MGGRPQRCWWCGSTRHDSDQCAQRAGELAQAAADAQAPDPDPTWRALLTRQLATIASALHEEAA